MDENIDAERERAAFEAWAKNEHENLGGEFAGPGQTGWYYWDDLVAAAWEAWIAARRTPASIGEDGLPEVKIERGRVWIVKGNQSFMLAYEPDVDEPEATEWYANQLRSVLYGFTPCVNQDIAPSTAPIAEDELRAAAVEVLKRWDTPLWRQEVGTAALMNRLRAALSSRPAGEVELPPLPLGIGAGHYIHVDHVRAYGQECARAALASKPAAQAAKEKGPTNG